MNSPRDFIREICAEQGIALERLSQDYVLRLTKGGLSRHIFGPYSDINSAAADRIACDKTACYTLLNSGGIPAVPHAMLLNPLRRAGYTGTEGTWARAFRLFDKFNGRVVLKPNQGTRGLDVYYCDSVQALEAAAQSIFNTHPDAAMSPYLDIETEYRVFFVKGDCPFSYGKTKGNSFQHNLSQGAEAFEISDALRLVNLKTLAKRAAECIGINFASVDIAETPSGELSIMEINSGVQARQLLEQHPHLRPVVKEIYTEAVLGMFGANA